MTDTPDIDAVVERLTEFADQEARIRLPARQAKGRDEFVADLRALLADHARLARGRAVLERLKEAAVAYAVAVRRCTAGPWDPALYSDAVLRSAQNEWQAAALAYAKAIKEEGR